MFNATKPFQVSHLSPEGAIKPVEMQYPSDEDWCEREARRRTIIAFDAETGDPETTREEPDEEESALVAKLCPELPKADAFEAGRLLDELAFVEVGDEEKIVEGNRLVVPLRVYQADTVHIFRMPTAKEQEKFNRVRLDQQKIGKRKIASVVNHREVAKLYDLMIQETRGYDDQTPIPIIHKSTAVFGAFAALELVLKSGRNPTARGGQKTRHSA